MRKNAIAYDQLYALLRPAVWHKTVLEVATGTGQVAKHLLCSADHIEATDASAAMIAQAKRGNFSSKLYFSVQDMFHLPYADQSFDVVIVSNALHIVPHPEKALIEFRRVLKNDGTLIAPTFTHAENSHWGRLQALALKIAGFPLHSRWTSAVYLVFLQIFFFKWLFPATAPSGRITPRNRRLISRNETSFLISCTIAK